MSKHLLFLGCIWSLLVVLGLIEAARHRQALARVPLRVHVNGTRGKTSVVRLIAAGLRAGGIRVCAKTSGTLASMTLPDGVELPVFRPAQPNIIEQLRVMRRMAVYRPDAIVIECMALQPHYQSLTERKMIRATHGVITNARPDHLDVMGPEPEDVARALAGTTPIGTRLYTCETQRVEPLAHAARDRGSELIQVLPEDAERVDPQDLARFRYAEHAENVALALRVCEDLGVPREQAMEGMVGLAPEPGATRISHLDYFGKDIVFVHAFAANDPDSTERIWERVVARYGAGRTKIAVVNCRQDRPDRSRQMAEVACRWTPADRYVLIGSGTMLFVRRALEGGIPPTALSLLERASTPETVETILEHAGKRALVVGMANIHGGGLELARYYQNRSVESDVL